VVKHSAKILQKSGSERRQTTRDNDETNLNCFQRFSCYLTVSIFFIHYKNKPAGAVERNDYCLSQEIYQIRQQTLWAERRNLYCYTW